MSEFDLTELASSYWKIFERPRRLKVLGFVALGSAMAVVGFILLSTGGSIGPSGRWIGPLTLFIAGCLVAFVAYPFLRFSPQVATRLSVGPSGFEIFGRNGSTGQMDWTSRELHLRILDRRGMESPPVGPTRVDFVLSASPGPNLVAPIPMSAVEEVLGAARDHGLTVTGWVEIPAGSNRRRVIQTQAKSG